MSADVWVSFWDAPQGVATNKQMTTSTVTAGHHGLSTGTEQVDSGKMQKMLGSSHRSREFKWCLPWKLTGTDSWHSHSFFSAPAIDLTQPECNNMFATRKGSTMLDGQLAMLVTCELRKCWPLYLLNQLLGTMFPPWTPKVKNTFAHERKMNKTLGNPKWELNKLAGNQDSFVA